MGKRRSGQTRVEGSVPQAPAEVFRLRAAREEPLWLENLRLRRALASSWKTKQNLSGLILAGHPQKSRGGAESWAPKIIQVALIKYLGVDA